MATNPQNNITPQQPATPDRVTEATNVDPTNADGFAPGARALWDSGFHSVDLGVNEAKEMTGYPQLGQAANVSMTDAQPGGGPTVTTEAGPY